MTDDRDTMLDETEEVFVFPTSFAQQRLWIIDQLEPGRPTYNIPFNVRLVGALDVAALSRAFDYLVERHETLRTVFDSPDGVPMQVVRPPSPFALTLVDASSMSPAEREAEVARISVEEGNLPFDLRTGPLVRATLVKLAADEHALLITAHHIVVDGWSLGVLQRELGAAYAAFAAGKEPALPELPIQYVDFAGWQRDRLEGPLLEEQLAYWTKQLRHPLPMLDMPVDRPRTMADAHAAQRVDVEVPADVSERVASLARELEATPFMALLAAYQALLFRYTRQDDIIVGSPVAGRTRRETEGLIGFFVNTLALRTDLGNAPTFRQLLGRVRGTVLSALAHQDLPFEKIVEVIQPKRDRTRNPVFQTLFSLQDLGTAGALAMPGITVSKLGSSRETAKFELQLLMNSTPRGYRGQLEFDADLWDVETAQQFARHFTSLLRAAVEQPDRPIAELSYLSPAERTTLVETWNATDAPYPVDALVHELFEAQAQRTPKAPAVSFGHETVDYATLDSRANTLAQRLITLGVEPDARVAIWMDRSIHMIEAVLGVLKAGGAYVPVDPNYPPSRAQYMLQNADVRAVLTTRDMADHIPANVATTIVLDDRTAAPASASAPSSARRPTPDNLAYVLYTSGSTGMPKGVAMPHRPLVNLVTWQQRNSAAGEGTATLQFASLSFDVSFQEIFSTLSTGGCLVLVDETTRRDPDALLALFEREKIARVFFPFIALQHLADAAVSGRARTYALREVITAGEQLRVTPSVRGWFEQMPGCTLANHYGPTESHVVTSLVLDGEPAGWPELPAIGRPIENAAIYLLDSAGQPVPVGVTGDLFIGGVSLARDYLGDPSRTAERFLDDPFRTGGRMYRTGDLARYRRDGCIEYLGRADGQVKLRGFRIELGEVEAVLARSPIVTACAVTVREDRPGERQLVAYIVGTPSESTTGTLRALCKAELPEYMVPSVFVYLDALPLTPSGKVDRRSLPEPEHSELPGSNYRAPRTTIEHELVQIWERLLARRPIGINDDFFEVGGHSLLAVRMLSAVEQMRGRRVPLAWLFESSTIEALAARIGADVRGQLEPPVVTLAGGDAATPLAFVHGDVRGGGWYCRRLAPLAAPGTTVHVLPTIGVDDELLPWTVESMAARHVAELRKVQPKGPYRVAGFCIGGIIAFEMARQLHAMGGVVDRLVIVDGGAINARVGRLRPLLRLVRDADENARLNKQSVVMKRLRWYDRRIRQVRRQPVREQLEWISTNVARRLRRLSAARGAAVTTPASHDARPEDFASALRTEIAQGPGANVLLMQERAASVYVPGRFDGRVDLIWAEERAGMKLNDPTRGWGTFASEVRVHPVRSSHLGLITEDLPAFAAALKAVLDGDA